MLMGALLFGRKVPRYAWAGVLGGVTPDLPMYVIFGGLKLYGVGNFVIFNLLYFQNWWQLANAVSHSLLMWPALVVMTLLFRRNRSPSVAHWCTAVSVLAASATLHSVIDMLCHREDAHMHFWPLTWWKFVSPVSYWDRNYFGLYFGAFEMTLGAAMALAVMWRYHNWGVRVAASLSLLFYVGVPAYFYLT